MYVPIKGKKKKEKRERKNYTGELTFSSGIYISL